MQALHAIGEKAYDERGIEIPFPQLTIHTAGVR